MIRRLLSRIRDAFTWPDLEPPAPRLGSLIEMPVKTKPAGATVALCDADGFPFAAVLIGEQGAAAIARALNETHQREQDDEARRVALQQWGTPL